jgi:CheY-like chemotaxis protein
MQIIEEPNILIVDDTFANLLAMRAALSGLCVKLHEAGSGNEALKQLLRHEMSLIFMDVRMPIMDGYETAQCLRELEEYKNIPIIFVTGNDDETSDKSLKFEDSTHIYKPIDRHQIRQLVGKYLYVGLKHA